ncbi:MAG: fibronectin type III domain-containing protein [Patescibacteria group bacterium]|nr:fibronectin type III domain-containing protein [Patescibacteria group bacterium]
MFRKKFLYSFVIFSLVLSNFAFIPFVNAKNHVVEDTSFETFESSKNLHEELQSSIDKDSLLPSIDNKGNLKLDAKLQRLVAEFSKNKTEIKSTAQGEEDNFSLEPITLYRGLISKSFVSKNKPFIKDDSVYIDRGLLIEKVKSSQDGIVQDFIIKEKIKGGGNLNLLLELSGADIEDVFSNSINLVTDKSKRELIYNNLKVFDANQKEVPAKFVLQSENSFLISIDDINAKYPLYIDPTFSDSNWTQIGENNGVNNRVQSIKMDTNGNLYVGGLFTFAGVSSVSYIAKWDGSNWSTLGSGVNGYVYAMILDNNNNLYVGGAFTTAGGNTANRIAMWDGTNWNNIGDGAENGLDNDVNAVSLGANGNLYVGGTFLHAGSIVANRIAMWDGTNWNSIGENAQNGLNNVVNAVSLDTDGNLYVGGTFTTAGGSTANRIAMWNGTNWTNLSTGMNQMVNSILVNGSDVYVAGLFTTAGGTAANRIAMWNGLNWSSLGNGLGGNVSAMDIDITNGLLYVVGDFTSAAGSSANRIAVWNGSNWSALGSGLGNYARAVFVDPSGNVYVGGAFTTAGSNNVGQIAKWNGIAWTSDFFVGGSFNGEVFDIAMDSNSNLYIGGWFTIGAGVAANYIIKWNGSEWLPLGTGLNQRVLSIAIDQTNNNVYVGGAFTTAGGGVANRVAMWNGNLWSAVGTSGMNNIVNALVLDSDNNLYAGGTFITADGNSASKIAMWNGSAWSGLGSGLSDYVATLAVDGTDIYAGGQFTTAGGSAANYIAKWDGIAWHSLGSGLNVTVNSIFVESSENIYVGGKFTTAGGSAASYIAKWDGTAWYPLGSGVNNWVQSIIVGSDNNLYVAGLFTTAGGNTANRIAMWDGLTWNAIGSGLNGNVDTLHLDSYDNIYVGGAFTLAGNVYSPYLAYFSLVSNSAPTLSTPTATPATDTVGDITISSVVNDADTNNLSVSYAYEAGTCGSYVAQPSPTIISSSDDNDTLTVTSNEPTGVSTAVADNTVESVWDISADSLIPNTQYCVYSFVNDGTVDSDVSTTTVYTNPAQPLSLTVTANGQTAANLTWTANSNPSTTVYKIYSDAGANLRGSTTSTSYTVTGLTAGNNYTFTVRAINNSDNTSYVESDTSSAIATAPIANAVTLTLQVNSGEPSYQFLSKLNEVHTAEVVSIIEDNSVLKAQVTIHSNPVTVTLAAGQSQNVDLNGDGTNDTTVTMNSVSSGQANFTLTFIPSGSPRFFDNPPKVVEGKEAITINNGELTTNNKQVKLNFNVTNAKQMAVSSDPNFKDVSFENYLSTKDFSLTEGNGLKTVYAKFRSADGGTIVYTATITLTGQKNDQIVNTPEKKEVVTNCSLIPGQAYKMKNSSVIYYITNDCTKQKIANEKNYFSYFSNWSEVKTIEATELNKVSLDKNKETAWGPKYDPKYGALVKTLNDPKVYLLLNDSKYWITSEKVFETLRYSWNWIEQVSQELLNKYTTKEEITTTTSHPNYTLVKYKNNPRVYRLEPNSIDTTKQVKRYIPNETEFYKLNFRFDRVVTIPDTEVYTDGETLKS